MQAADKSEKIKIYVVIGLCILMVVVAYFRFFHGKSRPRRVGPPPPGPTAALPALPPAALNIPPAAGNSIVPGQDPDPPLPMNIRDIFSPAAPLSSIENRGKKAAADAPDAPPPQPLTQLKLMGTIVEGDKPMAIINDQFVRPGDRIGGYEVTKIDKKSVHLRVVAQPDIQKVLDFSE